MREATRDPIKAFHSAKGQARRRHILWTLTFDEWWQIWQPHWQARCDGKPLQMCRTEDKGGYTLGNVRIDTAKNNLAERTAIISGALESLKSSRIDLASALAEVERKAMEWALTVAAGNQTHAAAALGITFRAWRYLRRKHGY